MKTILHIEGMSCPHCVKHVAEALKEIPGVTEAMVHLEHKTAEITHSAPIDNGLFAQAIDEAGYEVTGYA